MSPPIEALVLLAQVLGARGDSAHRGLRDRAELEAFVDGVMTAQLRDHHVAGAAVSVVKDGVIWFAKGYGYADVARRTPVDAAGTLFRVGSISKLFTWTAVMQQVERGKLDLHRDINAYLDFTIPATFPEPITLIHVMTHTPGLEEDPRGLIVDDPKLLQPMSQWLPAHMPKRVRPPGTYASYSNWATATAGHIVERIAGVPFDDYIDANLLRPLGMERTTFRQPLPAALAGGMSVGYHYDDGRFEPKSFEIAAGAEPAASVSATATDMATFMIAHLANGAAPGGGRILAESTAVKMHGRIFGPDARIPGFAYGFYEQSRNGLRMIGHGGDTQWFHSNLALIPSEQVGIFVSYNTDTGGRLTEPFIDAFADHYYPTPEPWVVSKATPKELERFAGHYLNDRMNYTTFLKAVSLTQDGSIAVADSGVLVARLGGEPIRFVPVDSLLFRDENTGLRLAFQADSSGRITHAFLSDDPTSAYYKVSRALSPQFHVVLLLGSLALFALTVIAAAARLLGGRGSAGLPDRPLLVVLSLTFWLAVVTLGALHVSFASILHDELGGVKIVLAVILVGALLTVAAGVAAVRQWRRGTGSLAGRIRFTTIVIVAVGFLWSLRTWNLLGWKV